jgi:hypothetical protein
MASLRNLTIGILRRHGHRNIAAALRRNARDATRVLPLLASQAREPDTPGFAEALGSRLPTTWPRAEGSGPCGAASLWACPQQAVPLRPSPLEGRICGSCPGPGSGKRHVR